MNLTGLKSLDLSRNSLVSLEGIQHLASLERLSLYHNCVSSLAEVLRLRSLPELRDVDLRLNPVVKNQPGYRLVVLHALPKLRQLGGRRLCACLVGPVCWGWRSLVHHAVGLSEKGW